MRTTVMLNAVYLVHWPKGFWNTNGGYEFDLLIAASAVALAAIGPWWAFGVAGVAVLTLTAGRRRPVIAEAAA